MAPLKIIPSKDVPPPGPVFRGSRRRHQKAAEADIVLVVKGNAIGVLKSRNGTLIVTHHERDENDALVFSLRYQD